MAESRKSLASNFQQASSKKAESSQWKSSVRVSDSRSPGRATKQTHSPHRKAGLKDTETETAKKTQSPHRRAGARGIELETETEKKLQSPHRKSSAKETERCSARKTQSPHRKFSTKDTDSSAVKKTQSPHRKSSAKDTECTVVKRSAQSKLSCNESESCTTKPDPHQHGIGKVRPSSQPQKMQPSSNRLPTGSAKKSKKALARVMSSDPPINPTGGDTPPLPDPQHSESDPPQGHMLRFEPSEAAPQVTAVTPLQLLSDGSSTPPAPTFAVSQSTTDPPPSNLCYDDTIPVPSASKDPPTLTSDNDASDHVTPDLSMPHTSPPPPVPPQTVSSSLSISEISMELDRQAAASEDSDSDSASSDGAGTVKEAEHSGSQRASTEQWDNMAMQPQFELPAEQIERDVFEDVIEEEECEAGEEESDRGDSTPDSMLLTQRLDLSDITKDLSDLRSTFKESSLLSSPQSPSPSPRLLSREHSLTSTPIRKRPILHRRSLVRSLNLSQEPAFEDEELSLSSSEFSNSSLDIRNRIEELSDDSSVGDSRVKETPEFTDEQPDSRFFLEMPVPINKQLRIVTSVDRALNPRRRSSSMSSKPDRVLCLGRSSSENLEHVMFLDFLKKHGMSAFMGCFPPSMTMSDFR